MTEPTESKPNIIRVYDLIDDDNSIEVSLSWAAGAIALDKNGERLVVTSSDGMYVNVYSTNYGEKAILKYCRGSYPCKLSMPLKVISIKPDPKLYGKGASTIHLTMLCSSNGTIHVFVLPTDKELYAAVEKIKEAVEKQLSTWGLSKLMKSVMPNLVKHGS